ncbi:MULTISPECIES: phosphatase PAP2 family protein [unclassified Mucilaginibacter]|uniref:phosphatase PAP2 family protein n=1 Tax=unclassified Mucilaginibacter TaxID=2617802 RepID=UPI002AC96B61|nr:MULTISPECIES: phosphatase PAP2 family protein [unclassified Mucilaginibacter]MEB0262223.1 phosphatase PAP2 family protein [Mucilaginibacter sp. 10I4]MEB0278662.1 phosphatase PAP2 family protein [Mucilaginibacter sp. 10B2]MEB0299372.1 phosphatase PAP2 family protein [Mucilaginibacter sp. 5C4]WPX23386.1 phosphatase PAP2 family protein [Mucilaginibacter sp. 5C4]
MKKVIYLILCLAGFNASGQVTDTAKKVNIADTLKKDLFTAPDTVKHLRGKAWALVPPSVLIAYGASNFFFKPVRRLDVSINNDIMENAPNFRHHPENFFQFAPVALVYGLNLVGVHGKNTFIDRTLIFAMAEGMMGLTTFGIKKISHRLRPDGSNYYSFPSGHTANAFLGAEFMAQELGDKSIAYSAVGYSFATATGILRMYNRDHWFSDVVAGAGFGILSTKAAYLLYPYIRNRLFKAGREKENNRDLPAELKKEPKTSSILLPSYNQGNLGLQFSMQF